jgi:hypothetical protein
MSATSDSLHQPILWDKKLFQNEMNTHEIFSASILLYFIHCLNTCLASTLCGIDILDILSLGKSALVASKTSLGELVHTLIGRGSSSLDHIQNSALVGAQSNDFTGNLAAHLGALANALKIKKRGDKSASVVVDDGNKSTYPPA